MPDTGSAPIVPPDGAGGTLILVVGPSGAGKDTLIDAARSRLQGDGAILFWRRYITRDDQIGEQHAALSEEEFARRREDGGFFLSWRVHGLDYGIAADILAKLAAGRHVVLNVSRRVIGEARRKWPRTHVIQVTARPEVLRSRLLARGRESADGISERLERGGEICLAEADWLSKLDNSADLASAVDRFVGLIHEAAGRFSAGPVSRGSARRR